MILFPKPDRLTHLSTHKLDSLLGATIQETLYSRRRKMVVHSRISPSTGKVDPDIVSIGGLPLLSNNGVSDECLIKV